MTEAMEARMAQMEAYLTLLAEAILNSYFSDL
jgi:hypothetical protein